LTIDKGEVSLWHCGTISANDWFLETGQVEFTIATDQTFEDLILEVRDQAWFKTLCGAFKLSTEHVILQLGTVRLDLVTKNADITLAGRWECGACFNRCFSGCRRFHATVVNTDAFAITAVEGNRRVESIAIDALALGSTAERLAIAIWPTANGRTWIDVDIIVIPSLALHNTNVMLAVIAGHCRHFTPFIALLVAINVGNIIVIVIIIITTEDHIIALLLALGHALVCGISTNSSRTGRTSHTGLWLLCASHITASRGRVDWFVSVALFRAHVVANVKRFSINIRFVVIAPW